MFEKTLASGEEIILEHQDPPAKPWCVMCVAADGFTIRWEKDFATEADAKVEYDRWS